MTENEIAEVIVDAAFHIHKKLGPGLFLRLTDKRLGLLINFGSELMRDGISRVVNNL